MLQQQNIPSAEPAPDPATKHASNPIAPVPYPKVSCKAQERLLQVISTAETSAKNKVGSFQSKLFTVNPSMNLVHVLYALSAYNIPLPLESKAVCFVPYSLLCVFVNSHGKQISIDRQYIFIMMHYRYLLFVFNTGIV